jgi:hypothetical protein
MCAISNKLRNAIFFIGKETSVNDLDTAILRPGGIALPQIDRTFFTIRQFVELGVAYAFGHDVAFDHARPAFAKGQIVFAASSFITMPFESDASSGVGQQIRSMSA